MFLLESVSQDSLPDLAYLVGLGVASLTLDVKSLTDALHSEDVVTPSNSFNESQTQQEGAQILEAYIRIRPTAQYALSQSVV